MIAFSTSYYYSSSSSSSSLLWERNDFLIDFFTLSTTVSSILLHFFFLLPPSMWQEVPLIQLRGVVKSTEGSKAVHLCKTAQHKPYLSQSTLLYTLHLDQSFIQPCRIFYRECRPWCNEEYESIATRGTPKRLRLGKWEQSMAKDIDDDLVCS